jgi:hypothetical protein
MKYLATLLFIFILAACAPSADAVQTAIARTQAAAGTATGAVLGEEQRIQTGVAGTLSVVSTTTAAAAADEARIQTAIAQTQALQSSPTPFETPLPSETPLPPTPTRRPTLAPTKTVMVVIPSGPIIITTMESIGNDTAAISWEAEGSFVNGFVIVYSKSHAEPAYPDDYWVRIRDGNARSAQVKVDISDTYSFRVCEVFADGKCDNYSNVFQIKID